MRSKMEGRTKTSGASPATKGEDAISGAKHPAEIMQGRSRTGVLRVLLIVLIGALTLGALLAVGILLFGRFGEVEGKIMISTLTLAWYSLLGMAAALRFERRLAVWLGWIGASASAAAYLMTVAGVWLEPDNRIWDRIWMSSLLAAMACALVSLLLLVRPSSPLVRRVMAGTLVGFGLLWVASELVILWMPEEPDEFVFRGLGTIAILTALGAILTPILERLSPAHDGGIGQPSA